MARPLFRTTVVTHTESTGLRPASRWRRGCESRLSSPMSSDERRTRSHVDLTGPAVLLDASPVLVHPHDLIDLLREQFAAHDERVPPDGQMLALARVAAGFIRTSPVPGMSAPGGHLLVAQSFVIVALGWWTSAEHDYARIATLVDDAFHQRETPVPDPAARDMLRAIAVGLLRQRSIAPNATVAQLAIVDWLAALYLCGGESW
jgi:hypothetical protein